MFRELAYIFGWGIVTASMLYGLRMATVDPIPERTSNIARFVLATMALLGGIAALVAFLTGQLGSGI
jgi:hypothetical protein